ncbi:MAG TPA: 30S ribosomal protein S6 [Hyphomicrobiaceae bacterium]|nr:30S ribosomal protein S6 [Hyphomicrobiaceae bacterium]
MPLYEHVFLVRQDASPQQVEGLIKEFGQVIEEAGGKVSKTEYWGLKSLAYKIKKSRKAHYALMNIEAPSAAVMEMERRMGLSSDVIRFLTVRVDAHESEPSAQMRRGERDDRRGDRNGERGGFRGERGSRGDRGAPRADRGAPGARAERPPRPEREGSTFRARAQAPGRLAREEGEREEGEPGGAPRPPRSPRPDTDTEN